MRLAALDPLQRLFGGANGNADRATPLSRAQAPSTPSTSGLPLPKLSATPEQPVSTPRVGGLPPFRNASNGLPASAGPHGELSPQEERHPSIYPGLKAHTSKLFL